MDHPVREGYGNTPQIKSDPFLIIHQGLYLNIYYELKDKILSALMVDEKVVKYCYSGKV